MPEFSEGTAADSGIRPRVLVAEDDPDLRFLIAGWLEVDRYEVTSVSNAQTMLDELLSATRSDELPAVVISDHRMQGMAGLEAFRRAREQGCSVPFVLITAFGSDELEARARQIGVEFLRKPFDLDDLRSLVAWLVRLHRNGTDAR